MRDQSSLRNPHPPPFSCERRLLINRANHKVPLGNMWACRANCCTFSGINARSGGHGRFPPSPRQQRRRSPLWPFDPFSLCYSLWGHRLTSPRWARVLERIWGPENMRWLGWNALARLGCRRSTAPTDDHIWRAPGGVVFPGEVGALLIQALFF